MVTVPLRWRAESDLAGKRGSGDGGGQVGGGNGRGRHPAARGSQIHGHWFAGQIVERAGIPHACDAGQLAGTRQAGLAAHRQLVAGKREAG